MQRLNSDTFTVRDAYRILILQIELNILKAANQTINFIPMLFTIDYGWIDCILYMYYIFVSVTFDPINCEWN